MEAVRGRKTALSTDLTPFHRRFSFAEKKKKGGGENDSTLVVALVWLGGPLGGCLFGILTANKLSNYRVERLEEKVNKHNQVIERTYRLEGQMLEVQHDIRDIKERF